MDIAALFLVISVLALLAGTASSAVRIASRSRLIDALKNAGRQGGIELYEKHERDYELSGTVCRMFAVAVFVIAVGTVVEPTDPTYLRPLAVFGIVAVWLLTIAGALPIGWARYAGESFIARMLPALDGMRLVCKPVLRIVDLIDEIIRRLAGAPPEDVVRVEKMEREILDAVSEAETAGAVDEAERHMIKSVMDMDQRTVGEIMTPRTDVKAVNIDADFEQVRQTIIEAGHSRLPVYEETLDTIHGVVYAKDLFTVTDPRSFSTRELMRAVPFIPETKDLNSLLRDFQAKRVHIAIVLDEYGGTAGLVTIEDILEEVVGEITDEHEVSPAGPLIVRINDSTVEVDARVRVDEINEELDLALAEDDAYDTVGGYVFSRFGRVPTAGESVAEDKVRIEVLEADERKIKRLRILNIEPPTNP